jgi:hypothetical protein
MHDVDTVMSYEGWLVGWLAGWMSRGRAEGKKKTKEKLLSTAAAANRTNASIRDSNLSSGFAGIPMSPERSLRLESSILSCTKKNGLNGRKARELDDTHTSPIAREGLDHNRVLFSLG